MNVEKVRKQLNKVNNLFASIEEDGSCSVIERDLLKTYIQNLYEKITDVDTPENKIKKKKENKNEKLALENKAAAPRSAPSLSVSESSTAKDESRSPILESVLSDPIDEVVIPSSPITNGQLLKQAVRATNITESEKPAMDHVAEVLDLEEVDPIVVELFAEELENDDISSQLSKRKINDLNNAFSLNERIFTVNELFGKDHGLFADAIKKLNKFENFHEAKSYLQEEIIQGYGWTSEEKMRKAKKFIQLVRRRYV